MVLVAACGSDDNGGSSRHDGARESATAAGDTAAAGAHAGRTPARRRRRQPARRGDQVRAAVRRQDGEPPLAGPQQRERSQRDPDLHRLLEAARRTARASRSTSRARTSSRSRRPVLLQGGSPPDVIDFPQPGLLRTLAPNLITLPDNVAKHTNERLHRRLGGPRHRRRRDQGHAVARQRQVDGVVQPGGLRGEGLQGPRDARRDEGAVRPDRRRRGHPVVRRHRVGRGHRVADHRLVRGLHAAHQRSRGVRPVGQPRDPVQRPEGQGRRRRRRLVPQEPRLHGRREQRQGDRHDEVPGRRRADRHGRLLHAPSGELLLGAVPQGLDGRPARTATATSRTSTCPSPRPATRR